MKKSSIVLLLTGLLCVITNSCKKENQSHITTYLTSSPWRLASVFVFKYVGSSLVETDTLNTNCLLTQTFSFNTDQSCKYDNFICRQGTSSGTWQLSADKLTLMSDMVCKDTVAGGRDTTDAPFKNAQIFNLGGYSLVLQTGDINQYYSNTTKRTIRRFSFIHQD